MDLSRSEQLGQFILNQHATIRQTAKVFGISKSTVHLDVSKKLKTINFNLYKKVKVVLENNYNQRNIRGGEATRKKYLNLKNKG